MRNPHLKSSPHACFFRIQGGCGRLRAVRHYAGAQFRSHGASDGIPKSEEILEGVSGARKSRMDQDGSGWAMAAGLMVFFSMLVDLFRLRGPTSIEIQAAEIALAASQSSRMQLPRQTETWTRRRLEVPVESWSGHIARKPLDWGVTIMVSGTFRSIIFIQFYPSPHQY